MYSYFDYQFWLYAIFFLVACFFTFFIPGYYILRKIKDTKPLMTFVLALVLGIVMWGIQGYLLGYAKLRVLSYVYVLFSVIWVIRERREIVNYLKKLWYEVKGLDRIILVLFLIGLIIQLLPMFASGMHYGNGTRFYYINGTDGVMHLSYIQSIIRSFPPQEPGAIGFPLVNYHYWSDLILAELSRIFTIPVTHLFFQFFPFLLSLFTGLAVYLLIRVWGGSVVTGRWALFLLYFGGDAAYILYFILHQKLSFHTPIIDNGATQFFNMPHGVAKMIFIAGIIPLHLWITTKKKEWGMVCVMLLAPLVGFKVYFGLFAAIGFTLIVIWKIILALYRSLKNKISFKSIVSAIKSEYSALILLISFALLSAAIYFPPNKGAGGLFFAPLEWPRLILSPSSLDLEGLWLRRQVYNAAGNFKVVLAYDALAIIITLISIHGTRLLGFIPNKKLYKNLHLDGILFFFPSIFLFTFLGFYTLQHSGLFNVFNFFVVSIVVLSLFAAFPLAEVTMKKNFWAKVFIVIFILTTVPRVLFEITQLATVEKRADYKLISNDELEALTYLRNHTDFDSVVQSHPMNYLDSDTPYVSFFANRSTYFSGGGLLATHNQGTEERKQIINDIFVLRNAQDFANKLREYNIHFIYLLKNKDQELLFQPLPLYLTTFYENNTVLVLKRY